ncbi:MAG TPA: hypothetical protein VHR41_12225 [Gemmatimonadales bacterium]|jgi:hypothetical protein|nr:hypothetical protein [Gemmatimonadales bacterium]
MLTAAEELGLGGLALSSRVQRALYGLPEPELLQLIERLRQGAIERHVIYLHDGTIDPVRILPCPITVVPDQLAYIHHITLSVQNALKRLAPLYFSDPAVREILRLPAEEERWLRECWGPSQELHNPIFGRLDALIDFTSPMWKESLRFVEPNLSGIGGLHMVPTAERLLADIVVPALRERDPELDLRLGHDMRELLTREILDHMAAIGCGPHLCFIEPKYSGTGPDEQEEIARYLRDRHGLSVDHADPSELELYHGRVAYQGTNVDLGYRDYGVTDLLELEAEGVDVEPMRVLLRENRLISSIAADLDQKSCWEVLTDPDLCRRYFSPDERQLFQRHILWTRVLSDRRTMLPDGRVGDLLEYTRSCHEQLVLKPNRSYGGEGIVIGPAVTSGEWEAALEAALADPHERWVAQQLATIPVREFPILGGDGTVHAEPFYTVMGFAANQEGVAILARASQKQVVNVAQHGGLCGVMVSHSLPAIGA